MIAVAASRGRARGEIHPGLIAAGLLVALGLAWWFARPEAGRDARAVTGSASADEHAAAGPSTSARAPASASSAAGPIKPLYRWSDSDGGVHFTDVAPTDRPYVQVDVNPDRNVVKLPAPVEP